MLIAGKVKNDIRIAVIGNYLPRPCGIATFTTDVSQSLAIELTKEENLINIAMDDTPEGYDYPEQVKFKIRQDVHSDYFWAADYLNTNSFDVAIIQHEYGIYGGEDGIYILELMKSLKMPIMTNLHTVLETPTKGQMQVMQGIAKYSDRITVMSKKAIEILTRVYNIPTEMIDYVPHGIPDTSFKNPGIYNSQFSLKNKEIILTFGLLGPGKGIEGMIEAMPAIVKENPNVMYLILGKTHPHVLD